MQTSYNSTINDKFAGSTLLQYLSIRFKYFDEQSWLQRIKNNDLKVNDRKASADYILKKGDNVQYITESRAEPKVPKNIPIIFEDKDILVVNKPAHLPVHSSGKYLKNTLLYILKKNPIKYPFLTLNHRLDRETSGICILSKSQRAKESIYWQFYNRQVDKTYTALVWGHLIKPYGTIDSPIGESTAKTSKIRVKKIINGVKSKTAKTKFKVIRKAFIINKNICPPSWPCLASADQGKYPVSLVECYPITGRTNQIRVHLASIGHGVIGDKMYDPDENTFLTFKDKKPVLDGDKSKSENFLNLPKELMTRLVLDRQALHASQITFKHPGNNKKLTLKSPFPRNWNTLLKNP